MDFSLTINTGEGGGSDDGKGRKRNGGKSDRPKDDKAKKYRKDSAKGSDEKKPDVKIVWLYPLDKDGNLVIPEEEKDQSQPVAAKVTTQTATNTELLMIDKSSWEPTFYPISEQKHLQNIEGLTTYQFDNDADVSMEIIDSSGPQPSMSHVPVNSNRVLYVMPNKKGNNKTNNGKSHNSDETDVSSNSEDSVFEEDITEISVPDSYFSSEGGKEVHDEEEKDKEAADEEQVEEEEDECQPFQRGSIFRTQPFCPNFKAHWDNDSSDQMEQD